MELWQLVKDRTTRMSFINSGPYGLPKSSGSANISEVLVTTGAATPFTGSTNDMIRCFSGRPSVTGSDITYKSDAVFGDSFTINADGIYEINYFDSDGTLGTLMGISKNSPFLTTSIVDATNDPYRVGVVSVPINSGYTSISRTLFCRVRDVFRAHAQTAGHPDTSLAATSFSIVRVK